MADDVAAGTVLKVQADGSTIKAFIGGVEKASTTDTDITGNLRAGIIYNGNNAGNAGELDDWSAADVAAAATTRPRSLLTLGAGS